MNNMPEESIDISMQTPGQIIKAVKEARRISTSDVVQRLLLSKQIVAALEEDDYSKISAQVYAEGYLKAYAQFLQIPVDVILKSFRRLNIYSGVEIKPETKHEADGDNSLSLSYILKDKRIHFVLLGMIGALVLGLFIWSVVKLFSYKSAKASIVQSSLVTTINSDKEVPIEQEQLQLPVVTTESTELSVAKNNKNEDIPEMVEQNLADTLSVEVPVAKTRAKSVAKKR